MVNLSVTSLLKTLFIPKAADLFPVLASFVILPYVIDQFL